MPRMMRTYSREEIAAMEPGDDRFYLAEDVEKEIGKLKRKLRENPPAATGSDRWITNGQVPDDIMKNDRGKWGIFG